MGRKRYGKSTCGIGILLVLAFIAVTSPVTAATCGETVRTAVEKFNITATGCEISPQGTRCLNVGAFLNTVGGAAYVFATLSEDTVSASPDPNLPPVKTFRWTTISAGIPADMVARKVVLQRARQELSGSLDLDLFSSEATAATARECVYDPSVSAIPQCTDLDPESVDGTIRVQGTLTTIYQAVRSGARTEDFVSGKRYKLPSNVLLSGQGEGECEAFGYTCSGFSPFRFVFLSAEKSLVEYPQGEVIPPIQAVYYPCLDPTGLRCYGVKGVKPPLGASRVSANQDLGMLSEIQVQHETARSESEAVD